ncbi:hypothetical protein AYI68_g318 [Smittium mucronatum]|uniref:Secreted protein n=1 Tax=Smittium mucronatum TaxID=133383 RepID=A0A1R0H8Q7_9FUNG|nr:hypothetical protein AYI68_g318 [Smittium mucronatum]
MQKIFISWLALSRVSTVVSAVVLGTATSSTHRVSRSVITRIYLFPLSEIENGPTKSIDTISNGSDTIIGCSSPGVCNVEYFVSWHVLQVWM